jgi:hypothetical protein
MPKRSSGEEPPSGTRRLGSRAAPASAGVPVDELSHRQDQRHEVVYRQSTDEDNHIRWASTEPREVENVAAESPSAATREPSSVLLATVIVGLIVVSIAVVALFSLVFGWAKGSWTAVAQEVLKIAYQALAIGALGGLAKLVLDRRKSKETADSGLRERRRNYIGVVIGVRHDAENARERILAYRSVDSWSQAVDDFLVPARFRLRNLQHDLDMTKEAVFTDYQEFSEYLEDLYIYLGALTEEYAIHRHEFTNMEEDKEQPNALQSLPHLGDLLREGSEYQRFIKSYLAALAGMRKQHHEDSVPSRRSAPGGRAQPRQRRTPPRATQRSGSRAAAG